MAITVHFRRHLLNDIHPVYSVEEAFQLYGTWSGLMDFKFDDLYTGSGVDWEGDPNVAFTTGSGKLTVDATALASGDWHPILQASIELPSAHTIYYHTNQTQRQAAVVAFSGDDYHLLVGTDDNRYPFVAKVRGNESYSTVMLIEKAAPSEADVKISVRQIQFTDDDRDIWLCISMWMNNQLQLTYFREQTSVEPTYKFGFAAWGGQSRDYFGIRVPDLGEPIEWGTLDPGESPIGGLNRVIEGRYLKFFVRYDGSLRAWRPKNAEIVKTFEDDPDYLLETNRSNNPADIVSHVRMMGAYTWAESIDEDKLETYGHKFVEENNPMLMTDAECLVEAEREILRREENSLTETLASVLSVFLEPEDRIVTPEGDWRVSGIGIEIGTGSLDQQLYLRKYVDLS